MRDATGRDSSIKQPVDLSGIYRDVPVGLCIFDSELRYVHINEWLAVVNGLSAEEHLGRTIGEVLPDLAAGVESLLRQVLETGEPVLEGTVDAETPAQPGVKRIFQHHYFPVKSDDDTIIGVTCVVQDITERKHAEEALKCSERQLRLITDNAQAFIAYVDSSQCYRFVNERYAKLVGFRQEEIIGRHVKDVLGQPAYGVVREHIESALSGEHVEFEARLPLKSDKSVWLRVTYVPDISGTKSVQGIYILSHDITERKQSEEALAEQERYFRLFSMSSGDCFWNWDMVAGTVDRSSGFERSFGYPREEILPGIEWWAERIHPEDKERVRKVFDTIAAGTQTVCAYEYRFRCKDGSYAVIDDHVCLIRDATGKVVRSLGAMHDITGHKRAEHRFRAVFEATPAAIMLVDGTGHVIMVNHAVERVFGYDRDELVGQLVEMLLPARFREKHASLRAGYGEDPQARAMGAGRDLKGRHKAGHEFPVEVGLSPVVIDGQPMVISSIVDTTERMRTSQQMVESQAQLKSLASKLVLAEERERSRIALHLHDEVSQNLAFSKLKLQMVTAALDDQTQIHDIAEVCDCLTRMMQQVRTLTFELNSPVLVEFGLEAAVAHWLKEQIEQKHGIATEFTDDGQAKPLEEDVRALVFRSVRELLANAVKHSQAKRVGVSISRADHQILICLEDDGVGFVPDKVVVGKDIGGYGIFSIREHLNHFRGSMDIDSGPGQGCRIILRAPLRPS